VLPLRERGFAVIASDITARDFPLHFVSDFFLLTQAPAGTTTIITNPAYRSAQRFAEHAIDLAPDVFLLLRLCFLESVRRTDLLEHRGLYTLYVFRRRLFGGEVVRRVGAYIAVIADELAFWYADTAYANGFELGFCSFVSSHVWFSFQFEPTERASSIVRWRRTAPARRLNISPSSRLNTSHNTPRRACGLEARISGPVVPQAAGVPT
jgi:hypothetical protein